MILLLCMQPWFSIDKCDSKPIKKGWKCHILRNFSVGLNFLDYEFKKLTFRPFLLVLNHICQSRIKVACKVAKSFLTLFPVTLVKVEVQESNLHQMNHKKVYFLTHFMQNVQKLHMGGGMIFILWMVSPHELWDWILRGTIMSCLLDTMSVNNISWCVGYGAWDLVWTQHCEFDPHRGRFQIFL